MAFASGYIDPIFLLAYKGDPESLSFPSPKGFSLQPVVLRTCEFFGFSKLSGTCCLVIKQVILKIILSKIEILADRFVTSIRYCFSCSQELPQVARIFAPAVKCLSCLHPNDFNFRFYQMCGYKRKVRESLPAKSLQVDPQQIDTRLNLLTRTPLSTSYEKQKQSLKEELDSFLRALPEKKTLLSASPSGVCRFLVWKDKKGKTQVHSNVKIVHCWHFHE